MHWEPKEPVYNGQIIDTVLYKGDDVEKLMYLYTYYNYFYKDKEGYTLEVPKYEKLNVPDVDMLLICVQKAYMDNGRRMQVRCSSDDRGHHDCSNPDQRCLICICKIENQTGNNKSTSQYPGGKQGPALIINNAENIA